MIFSDERNELRKMYYDAWQKHLNKAPTEPLENQIIYVIGMHPEYQPMFESLEVSDKDYLPENGQTNPFLHMGLHLGIRDQLDTNRPAGINLVYQKLCEKHHDSHYVEHVMMDALAEMFWLAQKNHTAPDETAYLRKLQRLVG